MGNIKSVTQVGSMQTYDLEVNHPDHQFYLSNGMLTSNSHSILYSMCGYQTAYLKAHYPIEFLLANLMDEIGSSAPNADGNIEKIKKEIKEHKVQILPPHINNSDMSYKLLDDNKLITGLDALKFVGDEAIKDIVSKRPFTSFFDFMSRVDSSKVRANNIQALAASGALDDFKLSRRSIFFYCSDYRKKLQVWLKKHDPKTEVFIYPWADEPEWSIKDLYALETKYLGQGFICKPAKAYDNFFLDEHILCSQIRKAKTKQSASSVKAIVKDFFEFRVKKESSKFFGKTMIKAVLEDKNGEQCGLTIFPDKWEEVKQRILELNKKASFDVGLAIHFSGTTNSYEEETGIILEKLFNYKLPPSVPLDLKHKKVLLKSKTLDVKSAKTPEEMLIQIEDQLYDEGMLDIEDPQD